MAEPTADPDSADMHDRAQALLPRYVEVERQEGNAAQHYPDIAQHINECEACRLTLSLVMMDIPGYDTPPSAHMRAADLPFVRQPHSSTHTIRPGSHADEYFIQISFPFPSVDAPAGQVARSQQPAEIDRRNIEIPDGGILMGRESITLDDYEFGVTLSLHKDRLDTGPHSYFLLAELSGNVPLGPTRAILIVGSQMYIAEIADTEVEFAKVEIPAHLQQVILVLQS